MKSKIILIIVSFISINLFSLRGYDNVKFERYGAKDGLGNLVIYDIVQDNRGYIWLGTGNGITRFDGYDFKNYIYDITDQNSIGSGSAIDLLLDSKGRLWVTVLSGGLYQYSEDLDGFIGYLHNPEGNSISSNMPVSVAEDRDGFIWVSTVDSGLNRLDPETGLFTNYKNDPNNPQSLPDDKLGGLLVDSYNELWFSTFTGKIYRVELDTMEFQLVLDGLKESPHLRESKNGDIWIPTAGNGVFQYQRDKGLFKHFKHNSDDINSLSFDLTINVFEDKEGHIWITTWGGGLNRYDTSRDTFKRYSKVSSDSNTLSSNDTWGIFQDRSGVIWVGTYGAGLNRYDSKSERFGLTRNNPENINTISGNDIRAIYKDSKDDLWIGTFGGGLNKYNYNNSSFTGFRKGIKSSNSIPSDNIRMIREDKKQNLWIATDVGLSRYNRSRNNFSTFLDDKIVRSIEFDQEGELWIGTHFNGVYRYTKEEEFINYPVADQFLSEIFIDSFGTLWVGGASSLHIYDKAGDKFIEKVKTKGDGNEFLSLFITDIAEDKNKTYGSQLLPNC